MSSREIISVICFNLLALFRRINNPYTGIFQLVSAHAYLATKGFVNGDYFAVLVRQPHAIKTAFPD
ncbi:MAG: hypothetical protein BWX60_00392 [Candidatus Marinimicrobia bacterium ADurb.Bin030]|nr:MAG: hypothetical protein BWX60_00392 [Candidatus Marinimicrobia bacterium ADurb.Bin030]